MKKTNLLPFAYITIFIIASYIIVILSFGRNMLIKRNYINNSQSFITYTNPAINLIGFKSKKSFSNSRILGFKKKIINSGIADKQKEVFYIIDSKGIEFYNSNGKKEYKYEYRDKDMEILSGCVSDIDGDNIPEVLILSRKKGGEYGEDLIIYSYNKTLKEVFKQSLKELNPWKVQTADVEGDGIREISIGVYKTAKFHPVLAKRPFIYNWQGNGISPKWRGSRLSRPFEDYIFIDIDNDNMDEIVSIEVLQDGKKLLNSYKWKGFGFEAMGQSDIYSDISDLSTTIDESLGWRIFARVNENNRWKEVKFIYQGNKLLSLDKRK